MNDLLMPDVLRDLHSLLERGCEAPTTIRFAIQEIVDRRRQVTELQTGQSRLVQQNRELKAIVSGHPVVRVQRIGPHRLSIPKYETDGAAGMDLRADVASIKKLPFGAEVLGCNSALRVYPGVRLLLPCGFAFEIPEGHCGMLLGRSSGPEVGLYVAPAVVDSDYRGVVHVHVENRGVEPKTIDHGDRVAQMVISRAPQARLEEAAELSPTTRGAAGFGSTGTR